MPERRDRHDEAVDVDAEADLVVLLDETGKRAGQARKRDVHTAQTPLHAGFSCYLTSADHHVLLTRRAVRKASWPGVWSGTCCGHPRPGEPTSDAVARRMWTELRIVPDKVRPVIPEFRYRAVDAHGVVENEVCPVFLAAVDSTLTPTPDPVEVVEWRWLAIDAFVSIIQAAPFLFTPWAVDQVEQLVGAGHWRT